MATVEPVYAQIVKPNGNRKNSFKQLFSFASNDHTKTPIGELPRTFPPERYHSCFVKQTNWSKKRNSHKTFLIVFSTLFILVDMAFWLVYNLKEFGKTLEGVLSQNPFELVHTFLGTGITLVYIVFYLIGVNAVIFKQRHLLMSFMIYLIVAVFLNILHIAYHVVNLILYETMVIIIVEIVWLLAILYFVRIHIYYLTLCDKCSRNRGYVNVEDETCEGAEQNLILDVEQCQSSTLPQMPDHICVRKIQKSAWPRVRIIHKGFIIAFSSALVVVLATFWSLMHPRNDKYFPFSTAPYNAIHNLIANIVFLTSIVSCSAGTYAILFKRRKMIVGVMVHLALMFSLDPLQEGGWVKTRRAHKAIIVVFLTAYNIILAIVWAMINWVNIGQLKDWFAHGFLQALNLFFWTIVVHFSYMIFSVIGIYAMMLKKKRLLISFIIYLVVAEIVWLQDVIYHSIRDDPYDWVVCSAVYSAWCPVVFGFSVFHLRKMKQCMECY
ncbi:unnamed protein product, partial [Mesorhabditis belari]|uniref:Uncharacterized protein n=1 Tax=Mesorhabditis belari TaxID=2138241 RepID=A0AAF3ESB8_9BILA